MTLLLMISILHDLKDPIDLLYGNSGIFLIVGDAGFISSTAVLEPIKNTAKKPKPFRLPVASLIEPRLCRRHDLAQEFHFLGFSSAEEPGPPILHVLTPDVPSSCPPSHARAWPAP